MLCKLALRRTLAMGRSRKGPSPAGDAGEGICAHSASNHFGLHAALLAAVLGGGCGAEGPTALRSPSVVTAADRFFDVQVLGAQRALVVGYGGKILLTTDGGTTWSRPASGTNRALYAAHFVDGTQGWIVGELGTILHSRDGGTTWRAQRGGTDANLFAVDFADNRHGWAVGDRSTLLVTANGGAHWEARTLIADQNLTPAEAIVSTRPVLYDVCFVNPNSGWAVGEFGKIVHSTDGGGTWVSQEPSLLADDGGTVLDLPTFFGVDFADEAHGIATGWGGKVARTADGGRSWSFAAAPPGPSPTALFAPVLFPDGTAWMVGADGEIIRLADSHPEQPSHASLSWLRGMSWLDPRQGWIVGGSGTILRTTDGGTTWRSPPA
jgi:photosystem II stability/assembly factor-like uncharacterized protein